MTGSDPRPLTDAAADLRYGVHRLARRLRTERSPQALSQSKVSVLAQLRRNGPTGAKALADADRMQPQSLTRVADSPWTNTHDDEDTAAETR